MKRRLLWFGLFLPWTCLAQGPAAQVYVVANKTSFVWGEPVKVKATVYDAQGVERKQDTVVWTVDPANAATVAADGTVTPRLLTNFIVRGRVGNPQSEVLMQAQPKRIAITPQSETMTVGATQTIRATALDINDQPIPAASIKWELRNAGGGWDRNNPMAEIDANGRLRSIVSGRLQVTGYVDYGFTPWLVPLFEGQAYVQMQPPRTYKMERIFRAVSSGEGSVLGSKPSALLATDNGFDFVASLSGVGAALIEWSPDGSKTILASGRPHASSGQPLIQFGNFARNHNGEILIHETPLAGGSQISFGPTANIEPLLVVGSPINGGENAGFGSSRNSLADSGMKVFSVSYTDSVTRRRAIALYRGYGRGLSDAVISSLDSLPGYLGATFNIFGYGITDDGTVWFQADINTQPSTRAWFRSRYGSPVEKVLAEGDVLANGAVASNVSPFSQNPYETRFYVAANGEFVMGLNTSPGGAFLRWTAKDGFTNPEILPVPSAGGVYWHEPGVGALLDTRIGSNAAGMYLWSESGASPVILLGDSSLDGSPLQEIYSATAARDGTIYAMVRTDASAMSIARLKPDRQVLLKAGDNIAVPSLPLIGSLIPGAGQGTPLVIAGGLTGSIARVHENGDSVEAVIRVGDPVPGGRAFLGSTKTYDTWQAQSLRDGRIVFEDSNGMYVWNAGAIDPFLTFPLTTAAGPLFGTPRAFTVNSQGDLAGQFGDGIYFVHNGTATRLMGGGETMSGTRVTHESVPILDDDGRVAFRISTGDGGTYYLAMWDGTSTRLIFGPDQVLADGRVSGTDGVVSGQGGIFGVKANITDGQSTVVRFVNNNWQYVAAKDDRTATGGRVNGAGLVDVNRAGDVVFAFTSSPYSQDIAVKRRDTFHAIHSMADLTPEGELLTGINQLLINDDGTMFLLGVNDLGQQVIYRATPLQ